MNVHSFTVTTICDLLRRHYCSNPEAIVSKALDSLKKPLDLNDPTPIESLIAQMKNAFRILEQHKVAEHEINKVLKLENNVKKGTAIYNPTIENYRVGTPRPLQKFDDLAEKLEFAERYHQETATSGSLGYTPVVAAVTAPPKLPPAARPHRGTAGPQRPFQHSAETKYCFFHGYNNSHWGEQRGAVKGCDLGSHMTAAQRAANKHTDVPSGSTKNAPA
jgi:hypothetical protein